MVKVFDVFDASAAYSIGSECHGWNEEGGINVVLSDDGSSIVYYDVPDGDGVFVYRMPDLVSLSFVNFLRGEGGDTMVQGDYILRRLDEMVVSIYQE